MLEAIHRAKNRLNQLAQPYYDRKIDRRIRRKRKTGKKIRIVFVCNRPSVWGALKTVYKALTEDPLFEPLIVTIPQYNPDNPDGYDDEGADDFFAAYHPIRGFDPETKTYRSLKDLNPDVVFFQVPYDSLREKRYRSYKVCKYAKIAYISYFSIIPDAVSDTQTISTCYPVGFLKNTSYLYAQNWWEADFIQSLLKGDSRRAPQLVITGFPKYDEMQGNCPTESGVWNFPEKENHFRVLWTPRWTTNENACHFFAYKDKLAAYCEEHADVDFVFRPHPQAWIEYRKTGEFTDSQRRVLEAQYAQSPNMAIDNQKAYIETFFSSDCLISDSSSMIFQYYVTGKPIVFCNNPLSINTLDRDSAFGRSLYWAETWEEAECFLEMLRHGEDPCREERQRVIREVFQIDLQVSAGTKVKEALKKQLAQ